MRVYGALFCTVLSAGCTVRKKHLYLRLRLRKASPALWRKGDSAPPLLSFLFVRAVFFTRENSLTYFCHTPSIYFFHVRHAKYRPTICLFFLTHGVAHAYFCIGWYIPSPNLASTITRTQDSCLRRSTCDQLLEITGSSPSRISRARGGSAGLGGVAFATR